MANAFNPTPTTPTSAFAPVSPYSVPLQAAPMGSYQLQAAGGQGTIFSGLMPMIEGGKAQIANEQAQANKQALASSQLNAKTKAVSAYLKTEKVKDPTGSLAQSIVAGGVDPSLFKQTPDVAHGTPVQYVNPTTGQWQTGVPIYDAHTGQFLNYAGVEGSANPHPTPAHHGGLTDNQAARQAAIITAHHLAGEYPGITVSFGIDGSPMINWSALGGAEQAKAKQAYDHTYQMVLQSINPQNPVLRGYQGLPSNTSETNQPVYKVGDPTQVKDGEHTYNGYKYTVKGNRIVGIQPAGK